MEGASWTMHLGYMHPQEMPLCFLHSDLSTTLVLYRHLASKSWFKSGHIFLENDRSNTIFLTWLRQYFTGFMRKKNNVRRKSVHTERCLMEWHYCNTTKVGGGQRSGLPIQFLYGFASLQSLVGLYFWKYKSWHCLANQIPSFSSTELPSIYVLDFLL